MTSKSGFHDAAGSDTKAMGLLVTRRHTPATLSISHRRDERGCRAVCRPALDWEDVRTCAEERRVEHCDLLWQVWGEGPRQRFGEGLGQALSREETDAHAQQAHHRLQSGVQGWLERKQARLRSGRIHTLSG
jgi:hypothetical protein